MANVPDCRRRAALHGGGRILFGVLLTLATLCCAELAEQCELRRVGGPMCSELFLLGVQKGGTTSIFFWLRQIYPEQLIFASYAEGFHKKEPNFFTNSENRDLDEYIKLFPKRKSSFEVAIDASPNYLVDFNVAQRLTNFMPPPRSRFIISLRNPVHRSYSWYKHVMTELYSVQWADYYIESYKHFDSRYTSMVRTVVPAIVECVEDVRMGGGKVYEQCARFSSRWDNVTIAESAFKAPVKNARTVLELFIDGCYGYILEHWLQHVHPSMFCLLFYEKLVEDFGAEMEHIRPCLSHFGLPKPASDLMRMPWINRHPCPQCELVDKDLMQRVGSYLYTQLYGKSDAVMQTLLHEVFGREDIPDWSKNYTVLDSPQFGTGSM